MVTAEVCYADGADFCICSYCQRSIPSHLQQVRGQDSLRVTEAVIETQNQVPNPNLINIAESDHSETRFVCNVVLNQDAGTSPYAGYLRVIWSPVQRMTNGSGMGSSLVRSHTALTLV